MNIVIASGKGGTGKTLISTNLAVILDKMGRNVTYLDCDVEEPDGHLLLKPQIDEENTITLKSQSVSIQRNAYGAGSVGRYVPTTQ